MAGYLSPASTRLAVRTEESQTALVISQIALVVQTALVSQIALVAQTALVSQIALVAQIALVVTQIALVVSESSSSIRQL